MKLLSTRKFLCPKFAATATPIDSGFYLPNLESKSGALNSSPFLGFSCPHIGAQAPSHFRFLVKGVDCPVQIKGKFYKNVDRSIKQVIC